MSVRHDFMWSTLGYLGMNFLYETKNTDALKKFIDPETGVVKEGAKTR